LQWQIYPDPWTLSSAAQGATTHQIRVTTEEHALQTVRVNVKTVDLVLFAKKHRWAMESATHISIPTFMIMMEVTAAAALVLDQLADWLD
jgi:hypothetical protein